MPREQALATLAKWKNYRIANFTAFVTDGGSGICASAANEHEMDVFPEPARLCGRSTLIWSNPAICICGPAYVTASVCPAIEQVESDVAASAKPVP